MDYNSAHAPARRTFAQIGRSFLEFLALPRLGLNGIRARVTMVGFEPVLEWVRAGQGAVVLTAHYGNWELLGATMRAEGAPMRYLLPPQSNQGSDAYFDSIREGLGIPAVKIGFGMRSGDVYGHRCRIGAPRLSLERGTTRCDPGPAGRGRTACSAGT